VAQPPEDHNMELRSEHQVTSQSEDWDLQLSQSKDIDIRGQVSIEATTAASNCGEMINSLTGRICNHAVQRYSHHYIDLWPKSAG